MSGESPLSMMRSATPRRKRPAETRRSRLWLSVALVAVLIILAIGLSWGWYLAASIADRTFCTISGTATYGSERSVSIGRYPR